MSTETKYTPGPWSVDHDAISAQGQHIAFAIGLDSATHAEQVANAARIVACVNACEGISTADLESPVGILVRPTAERDALRAENERLREALQGFTSVWDKGRKFGSLSVEEIEAIRAQARAALGSKP